MIPAKQLKKYELLALKATRLKDMDTLPRQERTEFKAYCIKNKIQNKKYKV